MLDNGRWGAVSRLPIAAESNVKVAVNVNVNVNVNVSRRANVIGGGRRRFVSLRSCRFEMKKRQTIERVKVRAAPNAISKPTSHAESRLYSPYLNIPKYPVNCKLELDSSDF